MPLLGGATKGIFDYYDPETQIYGVEHGGQHANVRFPNR
jgi:hypothetical protein